MSPPPQLFFGGATLGSSFADAPAVAALLAGLRSLDVTTIDTAGRYGGGASERLLGEAGAASKGFHLNTKILLADPANPGGSLSREGISKSIATSLERLGVEQVDLLYCHAPDPSTPLVETARAFDELFRQGRFKQWGVSNFTPSQLRDLLDVCKEAGFEPPRAYQAQYNAICRGIEADLIPLLRAHGMTLQAYSPLAGSFLTGKLTSPASGPDHLKDSRLAPGNPMGAHVRRLYDHERMHAAVGKLAAAAGERGISLPEASLRWLVWHSALGEGDAVILGASRVAQVQQNVEGVRRGPLPEEVVRVFEEVRGEVERG